MQDPQHDQTPHSRTGARRQGNVLSFQSGENNVLDFSSYRPGDFTQYQKALTFTVSYESSEHHTYRKGAPL
jgi:hypothetical protein